MHDPTLRRLGDELRLGTVGGLVPGRFAEIVALDAAPTSAPDWWEAQRALIATLSDVLAAHTTSPHLVHLAVWEGHGFDVATLADRSDRLVTPSRSYALIEGSLALVDELRWPSPDGRTRHWFRPDLWWPDDWSWFVGTDVDFWTTFIGGSEALVTDLLACFGDRCRRADRVDPLPSED